MQTVPPYEIVLKTIHFNYFLLSALTSCKGWAMSPAPCDLQQPARRRKFKTSAGKILIVLHPRLDWVGDRCRRVKQLPVVIGQESCRFQILVRRTNGHVDWYRQAKIWCCFVIGQSFLGETSQPLAWHTNCFWITWKVFELENALKILHKTKSNVTSCFIPKKPHAALYVETIHL